MGDLSTEPHTTCETVLPGLLDDSLHSTTDHFQEDAEESHSFTAQVIKLLEPQELLKFRRWSSKILKVKEQYTHNLKGIQALISKLETIVNSPESLKQYQQSYMHLYQELPQWQVDADWVREAAFNFALPEGVLPLADTCPYTGDEGLFPYMEENMRYLRHLESKENNRLIE